MDAGVLSPRFLASRRGSKGSLDLQHVRKKLDKLGRLSRATADLKKESSDESSEIPEGRQDAFFSKLTKLLDQLLDVEASSVETLRSATTYIIRLRFAHWHAIYAYLRAGICHHAANKGFTDMDVVNRVTWSLSQLAMGDVQSLHRKVRSLCTFDQDEQLLDLCAVYLHLTFRQQWPLRDSLAKLADNKTSEYIGPEVNFIRANVGLRYAMVRHRQACARKQGPAHVPPSNETLTKLHEHLLTIVGRRHEPDRQVAILLASLVICRGIAVGLSGDDLTIWAARQMLLRMPYARLAAKIAFIIKKTQGLCSRSDSTASQQGSSCPDLADSAYEQLDQLNRKHRSRLHPVRLPGRLVERPPAPPADLSLLPSCLRQYYERCWLLLLNFPSVAPLCILVLPASVRLDHHSLALVMDAFEIRLQFLGVLRKLTSSQASINKVVAFAIKHGPKCADDLWDCLVEESAKASINTRMNIFYALDSLLEQSNAAGLPQYGQLVKRDLARVVDLVVPETKEGVLNVLSTLQVLRSWKTKRVIDPELIEPVEQEVMARRKRPHTAEPGASSSSGFSNFSRNDIFRRIEDDRERHKRLRERIWVLPPPAKVVPLGRPTSLIPSPASPASPQRQAMANVQQAVQLPSAIDLEFEQMWEANGPLTDDELKLMRAEASRIEA